MQPLVRLSAAPLRNLATTSGLQKRILQPDVYSRQTLNASRNAAIQPNLLTKAPMSTYSAKGFRKTNQFAPHHRPQLNPTFSKILGQTQSRRLLSLWDFYFPRDMTIWDTLVLLTPLFFAFFLGVAFHWYTSEPEGSEGNGEDDEDNEDDVEEDAEE